jgi:type IV pilus assembly protein PilV
MSLARCRASRELSHRTRPSQTRAATARRHATGIALVEALVAVVVFAIGVLGIVGMQARSVQVVAEATHRADATRFAAELIARMRIADAATRAHVFDSASAGAGYRQWAAALTAGPHALPGAAAHPPTVSVVITRFPLSGPAGGVLSVADVTVTIHWQSAGLPPSRQVTTARILEPRS